MATVFMVSEVKNCFHDFGFMVSEVMNCFHAFGCIWIYDACIYIFIDQCSQYFLRLLSLSQKLFLVPSLGWFDLGSQVSFSILPRCKMKPMATWLTDGCATMLPSPCSVYSARLIFRPISTWWIRPLSYQFKLTGTSFSWVEPSVKQISVSVSGF